MLWLATSTVDNEGLAQVALMRHLRELDLSRTRVTDAQRKLAALTELRDLKLNGTLVTDAALAHILGTSFA